MPDLSFYQGKTLFPNDPYSKTLRKRAMKKLYSLLAVLGLCAWTVGCAPETPPAAPSAPATGEHEHMDDTPSPEAGSTTEGADAAPAEDTAPADADAAPAEAAPAEETSTPE